MVGFHLCYYFTLWKCRRPLEGTETFCTWTLLHSLSVNLVYTQGMLADVNVHFFVKEIRCWLVFCWPRGSNSVSEWARQSNKTKNMHKPSSGFNSVLKCAIQSINTKGRHKPDSNPQETQSIDQTGQMMSYKLKDWNRWDAKRRWLLLAFEIFLFRDAFGCW